MFLMSEVPLYRLLCEGARLAGSWYSHTVDYEVFVGAAFRGVMLPNLRHIRPQTSLREKS